MSQWNEYYTRGFGLADFKTFSSERAKQLRSLMSGTPNIGYRQVSDERCPNRLYHLTPTGKYMYTRNSIASFSQIYC